MSIAIGIQVLAEADAALLRQMLKLFAEAFEESASDQAIEFDDAYLARMLSSPNFIAIAFIKEGCVVGGLNAYVLPRFEETRPEVYIYDLAVAERFRRQGIATALIDEVRRQARSRGASGVYVQADCEDEPAIALYSRIGKRREVLHFDIGVEDEAAESGSDHEFGQET